MAKIYITVDGGAVQSCYSDTDIEVVLIDFDKMKVVEDDERNEILNNNQQMLNAYDEGILKSVF